MLNCIQTVFSLQMNSNLIFAKNIFATTESVVVALYNRIIKKLSERRLDYGSGDISHG